MIPPSFQLLVLLHGLRRHKMVALKLYWCTFKNDERARGSSVRLKALLGGVMQSARPTHTPLIIYGAGRLTLPFGLPGSIWSLS